MDRTETIYYKQDMVRTNPRNINETIFRYRDMYFKRLISDSIVGGKGHWYMYGNDNEKVIYDFVKFPEYERRHFWSHNTPYGMRYEFMYMLDNSDLYLIERLNDTIIGSKDCYRIKVQLENKMTMPGFEIKPNGWL